MRRFHMNSSKERPLPGPVENLAFAAPMADFLRFADPLHLCQDVLTSYVRGRLKNLASVAPTGRFSVFELKRV